MQQINEEWKQIQNAGDGEFAISNLGRIVNLKTKEFIRPYIHKSRANYYLRVNLKEKKYMVHVLAASAFHVKLSFDHKEVHHIDFNTMNNASSNLAWVTKSTNMSMNHHARWVKFGEMRFSAKLKPFLNKSPR